MSPIGRPHNPAATPGAGPRNGPLDEAAVAGADEAEPASAGESANGGAAPPDPAASAAGAGPQDPPVADTASEEASAEAPAEDQPGAPPGDDVQRELAAVTVERDQYLELARAKQAELENFRKQVMKRQADYLQQAAADLVTKLLPVLDALDNGVGHGDQSLVPVRAQLLDLLEKEGLRRVDVVDAPFDPNEHDAVAHEPADGGEVTVAETLRAGYWWNGRLLRPAMVRVRG